MASGSYHSPTFPFPPQSASRGQRSVSPRAALPVVHQIDARRGAVVLADRRDRAGLAQRREVVGARLGMEEVAALRLARGLPVEPVLDIAQDHPLGSA